MVFCSSVDKLRFKPRSFCSVESSSWVVLCCASDAAFCDMSGEICPTASSDSGGVAFAVVTGAGGVAGAGAGVGAGAFLAAVEVEA